MDAILKLSKKDHPAHIHAKVNAWCKIRDHKDIEDCGFILGLMLREDAHTYNPGKPGTTEAEAFDIGVCLALVPWTYERPPSTLLLMMPPQ